MGDRLTDHFGFLSKRGKKEVLTEGRRGLQNSNLKSAVRGRHSVLKPFGLQEEVPAEKQRSVERGGTHLFFLFGAKLFQLLAQFRSLIG
jgi:hypothetical protein